MNYIWIYYQTFVFLSMQASKATPPPPVKQSKPSPEKQQQQRSKTLMMRQDVKAEAVVHSSKWEKGSYWRLFSIKVSAEADPGKDDYTTHKPLISAIAARLGAGETASSLILGLVNKAEEGGHLHRPLRIVRKSFDARRGKGDPSSSPMSDKNWVYVADVSAEVLELLGCNPKVRFMPKAYTPHYGIKGTSSQGSLSLTTCCRQSWSCMRGARGR
jgi:hypothetical protein